MCNETRRVMTVDMRTQCKPAPQLSINWYSLSKETIVHCARLGMPCP